MTDREAIRRFAEEHGRDAVLEAIDGIRASAQLPPKLPTPDDVIRCVCTWHGVTARQLAGVERIGSATGATQRRHRARRSAARLLRVWGMPWSQIARHIGVLDGHTARRIAGNRPQIQSPGVSEAPGTFGPLRRQTHQNGSSEGAA